MSASPIIFALFGSTGDLAQKKIFPALEALFAEGAFPAGSRVVAISRRPWSDGDFRAFLKKNRAASDEAFLAAVSYAEVDVDAGAGYDRLAERLRDLQRAAPGSELVFYASLAPALHPKAVASLRDSGLLSRGEGRILLEKPFGTDEKTACELDRLLSSFLDEGQVCRIDHYLGKDTVRAIMDLHEAAPGFAKLLSAESVESVRLFILEEKGIDGRGASYDGVGAFRDVGQNHLLEMLAALAAEPKKGKGWQEARAEALRRLVPPAKTCDLSRRGQYEGYEREAGVRPGSETETAFEVVTALSSGKLKGVPLVLVAGKRMQSSEAGIEVLFRDAPGMPRRMVFRIQPTQEIAIEAADGSIDAFEVPKTRDAYGNVIYCALERAERSFVGREEIEALWRYADRVVACWGKVPLERYSPERPFPPSEAL